MASLLFLHLFAEVSPVAGRCLLRCEPGEQAGRVSDGGSHGSLKDGGRAQGGRPRTRKVVLHDSLSLRTQGQSLDGARPLSGTRLAARAKPPASFSVNARVFL